MAKSYSSSQVKRTPKNPGYGTIRELCSSLGYGSNIKNDPNYINSFRKRVTERRRSFVDKFLQPEKFPLDYQHTDVKNCVSRFMEQNPAEFIPYQSHTAGSLAKLMCMQEYYNRKNEVRTTNNDLDEDLLPTNNSQMSHGLNARLSAPLTHPDVDYEECSNYDVWDVPPSPSTHTPKSTTRNRYQDNSSSEDDEETEDRIKKQLEVAYPMNGMIESRNGDWLFQERAPCPFSNKPYLYRYLHDHNLYSATNSRENEIREFANALMKHLNLKSDSYHVFERCKGFIRTSVKNWLLWGLLVERDGVIKRTSAFEKALRIREQRWCAEVRGPTPVNFSEPYPLEESRVAGGNELKRSQDMFNNPADGSNFDGNLGDVTGVSAIEPPNNWSTDNPMGDSKRRKCSPFTGFHNFDPSTSIDLTTDDVPNLKLEDISHVVTTNLSAGQYRAPVDQMSTEPPKSQTSLPSYVSPYVTEIPETPCLFSGRLCNEVPDPSDADLHPQTRDTSIPVAHLRRTSQQTTSPTPPTFVPATVSDQRLKTVERDISNSTVQLPSPSLPSPVAVAERVQPETATSLPVQPTPEPFSGLDIPLPSQSKISLSPNELEKPIQTIIRPGELHFIVEKSPGNLDKKNPISKDDFYALTLQKLFSHICSRSNQTPESVTCLTFRYQWDLRGAEVLEKHNEEVAWEELKNSMIEDYEIAKEESSGKARCGVWVKSGRRIGLGG